MTSTVKNYGTFSKTKYGKTGVMTVTRKFFTREDARNYKRTAANPSALGIVNLTTGVTVR